MKFAAFRVNFNIMNKEKINTLDAAQGAGTMSAPESEISNIATVPSELPDGVWNRNRYHRQAQRQRRGGGNRGTQTGSCRWGHQRLAAHILECNVACQQNQACSDHNVVE